MRIAIASEANQWIVAEIVGHILINLKADAGRHQAFRIGRPQIAAVMQGISVQPVIAVVDRRPVALRQRVMRAGPDVESVGVGG